MQYVKEGGNLVVQYNRDALGQVKTTIGPYPFAVANIRVTDETAKVNFLLPDHKVLQFPNKITDKDFDGWIQERGIYFAGQTDSAYQAVLSMKDPGEGAEGEPGDRQLWKGVFVYTGLVFFRELAGGGAGRLPADGEYYCIESKEGVLRLYEVKRRDIAIGVAIVVGLVLGELIKRVTVGLLIGWGSGCWWRR
jgi:hypothetical protein